MMAAHDQRRANSRLLGVELLQQLSNVSSIFSRHDRVVSGDCVAIPRCMIALVGHDRPWPQIRRLGITEGNQSFQRLEVVLTAAIPEENPPRIFRQPIWDIPEL